MFVCKKKKQDSTKVPDFQVLGELYCFSARNRASKLTTPHLHLTRRIVVLKRDGMHAPGTQRGGGVAIVLFVSPGLCFVSRVLQTLPVKAV